MASPPGEPSPVQAGAAMIVSSPHCTARLQPLKTVVNFAPQLMTRRDPQQDARRRQPQLSNKQEVVSVQRVEMDIFEYELVVAIESHDHVIAVLAAVGLHVTEAREER
jgi:hypothetical protein